MPALHSAVSPFLIACFVAAFAATAKGVQNLPSEPMDIAIEMDAQHSRIIRGEIGNRRNVAVNDPAIPHISEHDGFPATTAVTPGGIRDVGDARNLQEKQASESRAPKIIDSSGNVREVLSTDPLVTGGVTDLGGIGPCSAGNSTSALLLTMYNTQARQKMYDDVAAYYADLFPKEKLFLVDSAGNGVRPTYVMKSNQVLFQQDDLCNGVKGQTLLEICSLQETFRQQQFEHVSYVVKLTTKYKLPLLRQAIEGLADGYDLILQNTVHPDRQTQNTEILGGRVEALQQFLDWAKGQSSGFLEKWLYSYIKSSPTLRMCRLPLLKNEAPYTNTIGDHWTSVFESR